MAVVVPLIAMYSGAVAAGAAITAGVFTVAGALTAMGGVFAAAGLLANDKDAQKLGATLGVLGGIGNALGFGSSSASIDAAATAGDYTNQMDLASDAASAASDAGTAGASQPLGSIGQDVGANLGVPEVVQPTQMGPQAIERAAQAQQAGPSSGIAQTLTGEAPSLLDQFSTQPVQPTTQNPLSQAASTMTQQDLSSWLENASKKAGSLMQSASEWAGNNKELVKMGLGAVQGAYGPQQQAFDYQKSLMDRARQNQNSPIRLKYTTPAGS